MLAARRVLNTEALNSINEKLNSINVLKTGFWFCRGCQHISELDKNFELSICIICGSPNMKHHLPIL